MNAEASDLTLDAFLGGAVEAYQPARGHHRSGLEAVLLGAALDADAAGLLVDLGAGAGVAGFCAASRCHGVDVVLAERDEALVGVARQSLALAANRGFARRVAAVVADVTAPEVDRLAAGLQREAAAFVLCNPPFYDAAAASASPELGRKSAHQREGVLDDWLRAAAWLLAPGGTLLLVLAAAAVAEVLPALAGRFGAAALLPIHSRPRLAADRLLIRAVKGRSTPAAILPGLVLHGETGSSFAPPIERILRHGAGLGEVHRSWQTAGSTPS